MNAPKPKADKRVRMSGVVRKRVLNASISSKIIRMSSSHVYRINLAGSKVYKNLTK